MGVGVFTSHSRISPSLPWNIKVKSARSALVNVVTKSTYKQGFIQRGGGPGFPPQEILKMSMVIIVGSMTVLFGKFVPDCVRSNLNAKFSWGCGGGICPQTPPSSHTCLHTLLSSCYHPVPPHPPTPTPNPV